MKLKYSVINVHYVLKSFKSILNADVRDGLTVAVQEDITMHSVP